MSHPRELLYCLLEVMAHCIQVHPVKDGKVKL